MGRGERGDRRRGRAAWPGGVRSADARLARGRGGVDTEGEEASRADDRARDGVEGDTGGELHQWTAAGSNDRRPLIEARGDAGVAQEFADVHVTGEGERIRMRGDARDDVARVGDGVAGVSYTHLTLPAGGVGEISGGALYFKKKK